MLTMTLLYSLLPLFFCGINILVYTKDKDWVIANTILITIFLGLTYLNVYFTLPSRNLLSIISGNGFVGLIYEGLAILLYKQLNVGPNVQINNLVQITLKSLIGLSGVFIIIAVIGELYSSFSVKPTWNSIPKQYSKSTEAPTFKRNETPIALAPATALNRVRKSTSDIPNSQYFNIPSTVQAQYYKGKPVYIIPLSYDGFFAMNKAKEIPGYFIIDATNQNAEPKFIKHPYRYAQSAYFNHDVDRQIYRHNPKWLTISGPQLEINDHGTPFWVQTVYESEAFSHRINYQQLHVVVMNAQTGSQQTYRLKDLPKFIDEGITSDAAANMNTFFGKFRHGYWNFSHTDLIKPTNNGPENGVTSIFNRDGSISYFTDFTNPNSKADSAMGYSMINARTGKLTYYSANGIMDSTGAKENADQNYKAQQWHASMPILYNINGRPTWVMTILDSSHAIRGYYYLDAKDQSIYGNGNNPTDALDNFRQALVNNNATAKNTPNVHQKSINGTVDRYVVVTNKNKVMFTLQNSKTIYTINTNDFPKANLLRTGDNVSFKATIVNGQSTGNVEKFKNNDL